MMIGACKECGGMVRARTPQEQTPEGLYHKHCFWRMEKKGEQRDDMPNVSTTDNKGALHSDDSR
jgi:hypothetical protein